MFVIEDTSDTSFELSSMFDSMSTSMTIAQECLKNDIEETDEFYGLDTFAKTINSSRKFRLEKTNLNDVSFSSKSSRSCLYNSYGYSY